MTILSDYSNLPKGILNHLEDEILENFVAAFKTNHKPDFNLPILWLVIHKNGLFFCNTHKTRGVFKKYPLDDIDSIKISESPNLKIPELHVLLRDLGKDNFVVTLPVGFDIDQFKMILKDIGIQIL